MKRQQVASFPKFYVPQIMNFLKVSKVESDQVCVHHKPEGLIAYIYPQLNNSPRKDQPDNNYTRHIEDTVPQPESSQIRNFLCKHHHKYKESCQNTILIKGADIARSNQLKKHIAFKDKENQMSIPYQPKYIQEKKDRTQQKQLQQLNLRQNQIVPKMSPITHSKYTRNFGLFANYSPYRSPHKSINISQSPKTNINYFQSYNQQAKKVQRSPINRSSFFGIQQQKCKPILVSKIFKGKNVSMDAMNSAKNMKTEIKGFFPINENFQTVSMPKTPLNRVWINGDCQDYSRINETIQYQCGNRFTFDKKLVKTTVQEKNIKFFDKNNNFSLCQNDDGRKSKYFIVQPTEQNSQRKAYCSKCAIQLVQKGYEVQEIPLIQRTTITTARNSKQASLNSSPSRRQQERTPSATTYHVQYLKQLLINKLQTLTEHRKQLMGQINRNLDQVDSYYTKIQKMFQQHRLTNHQQILLQRNEAKRNFENQQRQFVQGIDKMNQIISFQLCLVKNSGKGHKRAKSNFQIKRQKETIKTIHSLLQKSLPDFNPKQFEIASNLDQKLLQAKHIIESYIALNLGRGRPTITEDQFNITFQTPKIGCCNFKKSKTPLKQEYIVKGGSQGFTSYRPSLKKFGQRQSLIKQLQQLAQLTEENQQVASEQNIGNSMIINEGQSSSQLYQLKIGKYQKVEFQQQHAKAKKPFRALFNDDQPLKNTYQPFLQDFNDQSNEQPHKQSNLQICTQAIQLNQNTYSDRESSSPLDNQGFKQVNEIAGNANQMKMSSEWSIEFVCEKNDTEALEKTFRNRQRRSETNGIDDGNNPESNNLIEDSSVSFSGQEEQLPTFKITY